MLPSRVCVFAPTTVKVTGVPAGTETLLKLAVNVSDVDCAGDGDTLAGESASAGDGLVGTKPQSPLVVVSR